MKLGEMTNAHFELLRRSELTPTRQTLLERLRDLDDRDSWQEFYNIYWKLIYLAALKAGLHDHEAEEVVQETMISAARRMKTFRYEPERCSFKGWLMHLTRQHVIDFLRKRRKRSERFESLCLDAEDPAAEIPEMAAEGALERIWAEEWRNNLLAAADRRVRRNVNPEHCKRHMERHWLDSDKYHSSESYDSYEWF